MLCILKGEQINYVIGLWFDQFIGWFKAAEDKVTTTILTLFEVLIGSVKPVQDS